MKVLVVVDMQKDFVDGALGSKDAQAIVPNVCTRIESGEHDVVFVTKDTHYSDYLQTLEGKKLPVPHCEVKTPGWELDERVKNSLDKIPADRCIVIPKSTFGSLYLPERIFSYITNKKAVITEIEICGLCTDICVVSNALLLRANFPNVPITVSASCCAGVTPEKHEAALMTMESCQIDVID